jgi:hypothetical protein
MTRPLISLALIALTCAGALAACDKAKPRHLPPDPFAAPPPALVDGPAPAAPGAGLSPGLAKRPQVPAFTLDHAGAASDPLNRQPAVTPAGQPTVFDGFGFDGLAKAPAKGVDVVIDGKAYGTVYGATRADVAAYFKTPALAGVGFRTTVPAAELAPGAHTVVVRVITADGAAYDESPPIAFTVK